MQSSGQRATTIALPAAVDLDSLDGLRAALAEALGAGPVVASGAAVERPSTNGLLLLLSAAETARRFGTGFRLADPSAALRAAIDRLGLSVAFAPLIAEDR